MLLILAFRLRGMPREVETIDASRASRA